MEGRLFKVDDVWRLVNSKNSIIATSDLEYQRAFRCYKLSNDNCEFIYDYEKIYNDFKLNNQYWFAKLKDGSILSCGYGLVENEFNGDTWFEIGKIIPDELKSIDGYYTFDETHDLINNNGIKIGKLSDIGYNSHPDENSFVLIPKSDIIETYFK